MKIQRLIIVMLGVILASGALYAAAPDEGQRTSENDKHKGKVFAELNLTAGQQEKLQANRQLQREEIRRLKAAIRQKQTELNKSLSASGATIAAVQPLANEIKSLEAQVVDQRINGIFAVKQILTPEQFAKFQEMTEQRHKNRKRGSHSKN